MAKRHLGGLCTFAPLRETSGFVLSRTYCAVHAQEDFDPLMNLVPRRTECSQPHAVRSFHRRGIFKRPVEARSPRRKHGTAFLGVIADGDDVVELLAAEFVDMLGPVRRNI